MQLVKIISSEVSKLKRILKVLRFGLNDVQSSDEIMPYGIDSVPIKDMSALYAQTTSKGRSVIIGYINRNQLAKIGEFRTFSTDADGNEKFYTWLKNDGTMEIGGNLKNMVRYQELEVGFNQLRSDFNTLVNLYNAHIHPTSDGATGPTVAVTIPSTANISGAKIQEIKTL